MPGRIILHKEIRFPSGRAGGSSNEPGLLQALSACSIATIRRSVKVSVFRN